MNIVTINMELVIPDNIGKDIDAIVSYLNNMLNYDPEFFGDFGSENIINIQEVD